MPTVTCATWFIMFPPIAPPTWSTTFLMDRQVIPPSALLLRAFDLEPTTRTERLRRRLWKMPNKLLLICKKSVLFFQPFSAAHSFCMLATCTIPWPICSSNLWATENFCRRPGTANVGLQASQSEDDHHQRAPKVVDAMMTTTTRMMTGIVAKTCGRLFRSLSACWTRPKCWGKDSFLFRLTARINMMTTLHHR